jgi:hypothetical protein
MTSDASIVLQKKFGPAPRWRRAGNRSNAADQGSVNTVSWPPSWV